MQIGRGSDLKLHYGTIGVILGGLDVRTIIKERM